MHTTASPFSANEQKNHCSPSSKISQQIELLHPQGKFLDNPQDVWGNIYIFLLKFHSFFSTILRHASFSSSRKFFALLARMTLES